MRRTLAETAWFCSKPTWWGNGGMQRHTKSKISPVRKLVASPHTQDTVIDPLKSTNHPPPTGPTHPLGDKEGLHTINRTTMGRITVFTSLDLNSRRVKQALEKRELPFLEICLDHHPARVSDLQSLSEGNVSVPQTFLNAQWLGGVKETLHELRLWDKDERYACALEKYEIEIASRPTVPEDEDPRLASPPIPENAAVEDKEDPAVPSIVLELRNPKASIPLPDGSYTTFFGITEKLRGVLTLSDVVHKGTMYRKCFTGKTLLATVQMAFNLSSLEALRLSNLLVELQVVQPLSAIDKGRQVGDKSLYRLQCDMTPEILNSYRVWTKPLNELNPHTLMDVLDDMLRNLELESLNSRGKVDYALLILHDKYPIFEEAVCALNEVDLATLTAENDRLAFSLNLYKLLLRYAFCKVGFFATDEDRVHFMKRVLFQIGGMTFSFQKFVDGVLRANRKASPASLRQPLNGMDRRRKFSLNTLDWRVHCAINCDPLLGSKVSPPFRLFSASNVEAELDMVSRVYLRDKTVVSFDPIRNLVKLSTAFQWYRKDYGPNNKALLSRIAEYLPDSSALENASKIKFSKIHWTDNAFGYPKYTKESVVGQFTAVGHMLLGRFKPPPTPSNEKLRIATLRSLNLLDTPTDERINRITALVQSELEVPLVFVTLVDATRQWFKSVQWECHLPQPHETTRDLSFCGHTILGPSDDIMYVENALEDERFADNPFVAGELGVRFYAGVPLSFPSGRGVHVNIGTLCVIDIRPRQLTSEQLERLHHYALLVKQEILRLDDSSDDMGSACSTESVESHQFPLDDGDSDSEGAD